MNTIQQVYLENEWPHDNISFKNWSTWWMGSLDFTPLTPSCMKSCSWVSGNGFNSLVVFFIVYTPLIAFDFLCKHGIYFQMHMIYRWITALRHLTGGANEGPYSRHCRTPSELLHHPAVSELQHSSSGDLVYQCFLFYNSDLLHPCRYLFLPSSVICC